MHNFLWRKNIDFSNEKSINFNIKFDGEKHEFVCRKLHKFECKILNGRNWRNIKKKIKEKFHKNIYKKYFIWKNCITNNSIA